MRCLSHLRVLFLKIKVRPRSCRSYLRWYSWYFFSLNLKYHIEGEIKIICQQRFDIWWLEITEIKMETRLILVWSYAFFKIKIPCLLKFFPFCCTVEWIWSISNGRCGVSGTLNGAFLDYRPRPVKVIFELHMQMKSFQDFFFWSNPDIMYIQYISMISRKLRMISMG